MPDGGKLNLKVLFEAIDEMSGPLRTIGIGLDNMDKAAKAAGRSARDLAGVTAAGFGAGYIGDKLTHNAEQLSAQAQAVSEAATGWEKLHSGIDASTASADAYIMVSRYGAGSQAQELEALTAAYRLTGNYADTLKLVDAASRYALATHSDVGSAVQTLGIDARNTGVGVDALTDKLAKLYQVAGPSGAEAGRQLRQMQRAYEMAHENGVSLDRFLATVAEAQKVLGPGATRDLQIYFSDSSSSRAVAIRNLIDRHKAETDALAAQLEASTGAAQTLAAQSLADPAARLNRATLTSEAEQAARGAGLLNLQGKFADIMTALHTIEFNQELRHPNVTAAFGVIEDLLGHAGTAAQHFTTIYVTWDIVRHVLPWLRGDAAAPAAAAASAPEAAAVAPGIGALATLGIGVATVAGIGAQYELLNFGEWLGEEIGGGLKDFGADLISRFEQTGPSAQGESTRNVDRRTNVQVESPVRVEVTVHNDGQLDEQKIGAYIMRALDSAHDELERKITEIVDRRHATDARTDFDDGY